MIVLVAFASKHGSTQSIANHIAEVLASEGLDIEVRPAGSDLEVSDYDAVVLGSAVYTGRWRKAAVSMAKSSGAALREMPTWLFSVGPLGDPPEPWEDPPAVAKMMAATGARGHALFPGAADLSALSKVEKYVLRMVNAPEGDFRDWDMVTRWARSIATELRSGDAGVSGSEWRRQP